MDKLSLMPIAEEYQKFRGLKVRLGKCIVQVGHYEKSGQQGTWATGFKFTRNTYGYLVKRMPKDHPLYKNSYARMLYSYNHGMRWYPTLKEAFKDKKDMVKLSSSKMQELAFDGIQKINREYHGPNYKWRP